MHVAWHNTVVDVELAGQPSLTTCAHVLADATSTHVPGGGGLGGGGLGGGLGGEPGGGGLGTTHMPSDGKLYWHEASQYVVVAVSPAGQPDETTAAQADGDAMSTQKLGGGKGGGLGGGGLGGGLGGGDGGGGGLSSWHRPSDG